MLPINDMEMDNRIPLAAGILMLIAMAVFAIELIVNDQTRGWMVDNFGLFSDEFFRFRTGGDLVPEPLTLVTYPFLHANALHLFGNILFLFVFSQKVEATFGSDRFAAFAIAAAGIAGMAQIIITLGSPAPVVGLSGITSAVMGACLAINPREKFRVWMIATFSVPAWLLIPFWIIPDILDVLAFGINDQGPAVGAHLTGFVFGLACAPLLASRRAERRFLA